MRSFVVFSLALAVVLGTSATAAVASSDAAYAAFKADVGKACATLGNERFTNPIVLVDAHGSASYGFAMIYGRPQSPKGLPQLPGLASAVCVYDKKTKKAELSGEIATDFVAH